MIMLSLIIPVYNGEEFLRKCLDSIFLSHTPLEFFEVVIVNDGSPDKSLDVISEYTCRFSNITVFSQKNKGLGEARNSGVKLAKGSYIWFVDQDDWLTPNAIERVYRKLKLKEPDILSFEYRYSSGNRAPIKNFAKVGKLYIGKEFLKIHIVENPVWHYVIKSSLISKNNLHFQKENHEDTLYTPIAFFLADSVIYDDSINYIYNFRENSITTSLAPIKHCHDAISVAVKLNDFMIGNSKSFRDRKILSKYISLPVGALYYYWKKSSNENKKQISKSVPFSLLLKSLMYSFRLKYIAGLLVIKFK